MHLLLLTTPRPRTFFGWIIGLATAAAVIAPFTLDQPVPAKLATAGLNLFIGLEIAALVSMSARTAAARCPPVPPADERRLTRPPNLRGACDAAGTRREGQHVGR